jgi:hypothetical protein
MMDPRMWYIGNALLKQKQLLEEIRRQGLPPAAREREDRRRAREQQQAALAWLWAACIVAAFVALIYVYVHREWFVQATVAVLFWVGIAVACVACVVTSLCVWVVVLSKLDRPERRDPLYWTRLPDGTIEGPFPKRVIRIEAAKQGWPTGLLWSDSELGPWEPIPRSKQPRD